MHAATRAGALDQAGREALLRHYGFEGATLTPDGKVKVLDFSLAKAWAGEDGGPVAGSGALSE